MGLLVCQTRARAQVGRDISSEGVVGNPSRGTVVNMGSTRDY